MPRLLTSAPSSAGRARDRVIGILLGALLLLAPAIWNGAPFPNSDTVSYLRLGQSAAQAVARKLGAAAPAALAPALVAAERAAEGAMPAGVVVCHNDVCPENVVFRNGEAVALLDFDFAAPGRPVYDLSQFVRMCVPVADDEYAESLGFAPGDRAVAVRAVCDAYDDAGGELGQEGRREMLDVLDRSIARSGEWVRAKAEAGHPGFVEMWASVGGQETYDRRRRWWSEERHRFAAALA